MMRIGQIISDDYPFFCDLIVAEGEYGVAWHCGAAPCKLCKPGFQPELRCSATVEGGGVKGVTNEFPLKPGRVTLARLGETRDGEGFRMLIATGTGLDTDLFVRGNPLKIKFDALASHDITYVGILMTARAGGLEKFRANRCRI